MIHSELFKRSKENRQHSTSFVPYGYYECRLPEMFINVPMHWHPEFEIDYILEGCGDFVLGDEKLTLSAGDILILPPDMLHAVYLTEENFLSYDALVFHSNMLGANSNDRSTVDCIHPIISGTTKICNHIPHNLPNIDEFKSCVSNIFSSARKNSSHYDLLLKSELMHLFWLLDGNQQLAKKGAPTPKNSSLIRPALEYISEHFSENITVEQLASLLHLSKSHFMSCFKKAVGISAIEYLTQYRINYACEQLILTNLPIAEISLTSGYDNLSNFNRHFKKIVGQTPKEYRNQTSK